MQQVITVHLYLNSNQIQQNARLDLWMKRITHERRLWKVSKKVTFLLEWIDVFRFSKNTTLPDVLMTIYSKCFEYTNQSFAAEDVD